MTKFYKAISAQLSASTSSFQWTLAIALGISSSFVTAVESVRHHANSIEQGSDFSFIGVNMIWWAILTTLVIIIPLTRLGFRLMSEQLTLLVPLGIPKAAFTRIFLRQLTPAITAAFVIAIVLYLPFAWLLYRIPDSSFAGPLIEIEPRFSPSLLAAVIGLVVIVVPLAFSVFLLSNLALARERGGKRYKRLLSAVGKHSLVPIGLLLAVVGFSMPNQAGLFFSVSALLLGSWVVSVSAGRSVELISRLLTRVFGVSPSLAVLRSVAYSSAEKVSGYIQIVTWVALLPAAIFTASAIQARAEGEGGIAQWDFWVLFATPIGVLFLGFVCLLLVFGEVLNPLVKIYIPQGIPTFAGYSGRIYYFTLSAAFGLAVSVIGSLLTWILMAIVWKENPIATLGLVSWSSIGQVALLCLTCSVIALVGFLVKQIREDSRESKQRPANLNTTTQVGE